MEKLYVLVRTDLKKSSPAVQAGHAVGEWMLKYPSLWKNETLIYKVVKDATDLDRWSNKLFFKDINYVEFREPDINNEVTAIACLTNKNVFGNLKLL